MVHPVASDGTSAYKRQSEIKDSSGVIFLRKIDLKTNSTGALDKTTFWILDPLGLGGVGLHVHEEPQAVKFLSRNLIS